MRYVSADTCGFFRQRRAEKVIETVGAWIVLWWEFIGKPILYLCLFGLIVFGPFFLLAVVWHMFADWWRIRRGGDR